MARIIPRRETEEDKALTKATIKQLQDDHKKHLEDNVKLLKQKKVLIITLGLSILGNLIILSYFLQ